MPLLINSDEIRNHIEIDIFDYSDLPVEQANIYSEYEVKFKELFEQHSVAWRLENCFFFIKNSNTCNASAIKINGFNLINITNGYPILIDKKFKKSLFENSIIISLINNQEISEAYCDLHENENFNFRDFILDCSIRFTFHHEFRHILQFNFSKSDRNFDFSENLDSESKFSMIKHSWEYDADRLATYRVFRFAQEKYNSLGYRNNNYLKCILYIALSGIIITKNLFYFNVINNYTNVNPIRVKDFYTKKYSHPHSLTRIMNVITYFIDCANDDISNLNMDLQDTLNNVLATNNLYFNSLTGSTDFKEIFYSNLGKHLSKVNAYNNELYEFAIRNKSIKNLLTFTGTKSGA